MHLVSASTLQAFWVNHAQAVEPLKAWAAECKAAEWKTPQDIKDHYASASIIAGNRVVFNIGGNKFRLVVAVAYKMGFVYVKFVGTHAEYDKIDAATVNVE